MEVIEITRQQEEEIIDLRIQQQVEDFDNDPLLVNNLKEFEDNTRNFFNENIGKQLIGYGIYTDNKLVSVCFVQVIPMLPQLNNAAGMHGYICNVFTLKSHRKRGYQKKLLSTCIDVARLKGIKKLDLTTDNPIAMSLYSQYGFSSNDLAMRLTIK